MFVSGKPFQPSLEFVGKARSLSQSGAPERLLNRVGSGLTHKDKTRLERLARDKHSSLLRKSINYGCNKFFILPPGHFAEFVLSEMGNPR